MAAQESGFLAGEIVPVVTEQFEVEGYQPRGIRLQGKLTEVASDTHPRLSPKEVLAKLRPVFEGGVQTGGNSSALVDAAAACVVSSGAYAKAQGKQPLARIVAAAAVGVPPDIMGIGPAPAIRLLLARTGLQARATSPDSKSTKRKAHKRWPWPESLDSISTGSTSTAAPSPWATRSPPRAFA